MFSPPCSWCPSPWTLVRVIGSCLWGPWVGGAADAAMAADALSIVPRAVLRNLSHKLYEQRKNAAIEIEGIVRLLATAGEHEKISAVISLLTNDFMYSPDANHRKGGLIGLAATSCGLNTEAAQYLEQIVPPVLNSFGDKDSRVRYYACEGLYNIGKVVKGDFIIYFNQIFDALCKLSADSDANVQSAAHLLDRLVKDIITECDHQFSIEEFIPLLRKRMYVSNPYVRHYLVGWITLLDCVDDIDMLGFIPDFLDGLLNMLSDSNYEIRQQAAATLSEFLLEIKNSPNIDYGRVAEILVRRAGSNDEFTRLMSTTWMSELVKLGGEHNRIDHYIDELRSLELDSSPKVMPLELLRKVTNDFSKKQRLGSGTFGTVYKGILNGKEVAVKELHSMSGRDYEEEFMQEFENLRRLNHPNIVQLLGYCYEIKRVCVEYEGKFVLADKFYRVLCFDYMHNGSLQQHLHDESHGLDWQTRYKIIKGTCEGLNYLHKGLKTPMLHLDLKPGNILLDKNMVPKLADFGLSKLVCDNQTRATSCFLGTIRYCPPEHIERHIFSSKFDIFSLGVVMIEIITGPEGYCKALEMSSQEFIDHVQENWRKRIHQAAPGCTLQNYECRQVKRCIEIALQCLCPERMQRPDIEAIISRLNETENNTEKSATTCSSQNET